MATEPVNFEKTLAVARRTVPAILSGRSPDLESVQREMRSLSNRIRRIWPHLFDKALTPGTQNFELVTLTSDGGSGGDESTPCDFTYSFTTSDAVSHTAVSPVTNRLPTALAAKRGIWDIDNEELSAIDEWPDGGGCGA